MLPWKNETESMECGAQSIISNHPHLTTTSCTTTIWISCGTSIARGEMLYDCDTKKPVEMNIVVWNRNPLEGVMDAVSDQLTDEELQQLKDDDDPDEYAHISDGDFVVLPDGSRELWFGLEGKNWPRVLRAALIRFDADTLFFKNIHMHPTIRTMPWLVVDSARQLAYTTNWTDNEAKLWLFDTNNMNWRNQEESGGFVPILDLPIEFRNGVDFIQGADLVDNTLFLMSDVASSSLLVIDLLESDPTAGVVGRTRQVLQLGLGHEREGIAIWNKEWLLSMDNQRTTWEGHHYAQVVCVKLNVVPRQDFNDTRNNVYDILLFGTGVITVTVGTLIWLVHYFRCRKKRTHTTENPFETIPNQEFELI